VQGIVGPEAFDGGDVLVPDRANRQCAGAHRWPSTCTVQAPHCAMPHPNFVPISPSVSRSAQSRGVSESTSISWACPLTVSRVTNPPQPENLPRLQTGLKSLARGLRRQSGQKVARTGAKPATFAPAPCVALIPQMKAAAARPPPRSYLRLSGLRTSGCCGSSTGTSGRAGPSPWRTH
jgi:hypothetical protein